CPPRLRFALARTRNGKPRRTTPICAVGLVLTTFQSPDSSEGRMFPLNVSLIGCGGDLLQLLRLELSVQAARIEGEFLGVESAIAQMRSQMQGDDTRRMSTVTRGKNEPLPPPEAPRRLFIVHLDSAQELPAIKRLS